MSEGWLALRCPMDSYLLSDVRVLWPYRFCPGHNPPVPLSRGAIPSGRNTLTKIFGGLQVKSEEGTKKNGPHDVETILVALTILLQPKAAGCRVPPLAVRTMGHGTRRLNIWRLRGLVKDYFTGEAHAPLRASLR